LCEERAQTSTEYLVILIAVIVIVVVVSLVIKSNILNQLLGREREELNRSMNAT